MSGGRYEPCTQLMIRLGILGSTRGTNLNAIVDAIHIKKLNASIEVVISNKDSAPILEKAAKLGINARHVNPEGLEREQFDNELTTILRKHKVELVVLIGYMRILSAVFISQWKDRIINIHPSLLPAFAGLMDLDVHRAVIDAQEVVTGCTAHFVTEELDAGPVIAQRECPVFFGDTPENLKIRIQKLEGDLLIDAIQMVADNVY